MSVCPSCATGQPDDARFCFRCGTALTSSACTSCGTALVAGAQFCSSCGSRQTPDVEASELAAQPVSSRRVTSVLFGDLVGFTTLSENRDHEETRELLTRYFEECRRVIGRYGGTVEKFIGDAVMAVWGVPTAHEDDAERAVRAGLELVAATAAMGQDVGVPGLAMRVGIVTGEVAVTIGAEHQGMVAGDAVNTAARVQSVAEPGQVWVDETTRLLTLSAITYVDVGSHALKGKVEPMPLWSVHAVVASVGGAQRADGLEAPLVGRARELRLLKELFHRVEESRQPGLLVMVGEPGLGKTRLGWEFEKYIDGLTTGVRWHNGRCLAYGEGLAFFALAEALRPRLHGQDLAEGEDSLAGDPNAMLERGLAAYVKDDQEREWIRPRLGALLGTGSVGTFQREDLFSAWTVFLERVGADMPVVLVIDDAQHADVGLLLFVEHLLTVDDFPCFVLLLSRSGLLEQHPGLATNRRATVSHLGPLNDPDMGTLLGGLVVGLPDDARDSLVLRSEGVPLFAVETVRSMIDHDLVVPRGGQYVLADTDTLDLDALGAPASLQALIAARLDTLDSPQRRLIERASVIGNAFSREEIGELCVDLGDVDELLASLVRQQILSQLKSRFSAEFGQFQFVQSVVQQVAYAGLSRRDRRTIHLAVAGQTASVADPAGDLAPIIAQHYLQAVNALPGEPDVGELKTRAIDQLERAAARARSLGALSDSANHLLLALDLAEDAPTSARLNCLIAWALVDTGEYAKGISHAIKAERVFDELGDPVMAGNAAAVRGQCLYFSGDLAAALRILQPRWADLVDRPGAEKALLPLGSVLTYTGLANNVDTRAILDRRIQIAERVGDQAQLAIALNALGVVYSNGGSPAMATILTLAAADITRSGDDVVGLTRILTNVACLQMEVDLNEALQTIEESVAMSLRAGVLSDKMFATINLSLMRMASGRWDEIDPEEVLDPFMRSTQTGILGFIRAVRREPIPREELPDIDDSSAVAWAEFTKCWYEHAEGRLTEALEHAMAAAEQMYELSQASDDYVHAWPVAVDLAHRVGDGAKLSRLLETLDEAAARMTVSLPLRAHRARIAGVLAQVDSPDTAEAHLRTAIDGFTAWGCPHYRARAQGELGQWLESQGRSDESAVLLEEARATLTEMRAVAWLEELGLVEVRT